MHKVCSNVDVDCSASPTSLVYRWIQQGVGTVKPHYIAQTMGCGFIVYMLQF